jgi:hypothetical protein
MDRRSETAVGEIPKVDGDDSEKEARNQPLHPACGRERPRERGGAFFRHKIFPPSMNIYASGKMPVFPKAVNHFAYPQRGRRWMSRDGPMVLSFQPCSILGRLGKLGFTQNERKRMP